jgi:hypothetical protein
MRFFNRQSLRQHRRASTSSIPPELGLSSFGLFLLFLLPCILPQKASADAVFINFPAALSENTNFSSSNTDGSASGSSFSGNLIRIGAFSDNPTALIGGLTAITTPSAILANLESKFTQYTSFTFSNSFLSPDTPIYPTTDDFGVPLVAQPSIGASLRGQDIYLLFYNAATTGAADQLAIFRMKDSLMTGPTGPNLAGIFSTEVGLGESTYASSFDLSATKADMLIGQYLSSSDTFVLGKLLGGVGQITSPLTQTNTVGSEVTYQITANNGADRFFATTNTGSIDLTLTNLPVGFSIATNTGVITAATNAVAGTNTIRLVASNSLTASVATNTLTWVLKSSSLTFTTTTNLISGTAGAAITNFTFISTGASPTYNVSSGDLLGLSLSTNGVLSGIPTRAGTNGVTIQSSAGGQIGSTSFSLAVGAPTLAIAALDSNSQLTRTAGTAYTIPVTIPAGFTVDSGSITPAISGVTYSAGNLLISSTAAPFAKGTTSQAVTLTLNRTSGLGGSTVSVSLAFNLRLIAPAPTTLTTAGPFEVNVGEGYSLQLATDVSTICPNQNIEIVGTLPLGLNNNTAGLRKTGVITGTNTNTTSPWQFPVNVVADTSTFYEGGGTMTFSNVIFQLRNPAAPLITSSLSKLAGVGKSFGQYKLEASGAPSAFTASGLPPGLALTKEFNITGTPTQAGIYDVRLDAYNSYRPGSTLASDLQSGTATLRIFVSGSKPTTATPLSGSSNLQVGNAASFSMLSAQELGLRISGYGFPPGLSINSSTGMVTGTPTTAGTYSVTIFIQNGKGWIKKTVPLTVR